MRVADVLDLDERRASRDDRERERQMLRASHPSTRWVAGRAFYIAHRRSDEDATAACGAAGALVLAPPGVPLCSACYPLRGRVEDVG